MSVNDKESGNLVAMRAPNQNNPTQDVMSSDMTCGKVALTSKEVITIAPGDKVGSWWQHVIGGAQMPNDADNPIAKSHHGPITAWLAKVDDSATASVSSSLAWFKIAEDSYDVSSKKWAVDKMADNKGWSFFTMPKCIAPGNYLLRVELLALHSAYSSRGCQFYVSCANIKVTGSGTFTPSTTYKIPGVYQQDDPSIKVNIYGKSGNPDNNNQPFTPAGPRPISCS